MVRTLQRSPPQPPTPPLFGDDQGGNRYVVCLLSLMIHARVGSPPFSPWRCCCCPLASHADVAGLAAGVLLGVHCGQTHQLVPADLGHRAQRQVYGLGVDHLQDDVLGVVEHQAAILFLPAGQEAVVGLVKGRQPLLAEVVAAGAFGCHHQDDVVVGRVHAVEVSEVDVGLGVEEHLGLHLKAVAAVGGILRRLASVELCVAAEENALQLPAEGRTVAAAVVLHGGQHAVLLRLPASQDGATGEMGNVRTPQGRQKAWLKVIT